METALALMLVSFGARAADLLATAVPFKTAPTTDGKIETGETVALAANRVVIPMRGHGVRLITLN